MILMMLLSTMIVWRTKNALLLLLYVCSVYGAASMGDGGSYLRFALAACPILAIALVHQFRQHPVKISGVCMLMFALQLYLATRFAIHEWVG